MREVAAAPAAEDARRPADLAAAAARVQQWLLRSGIFVFQPHDAQHGAVYAFYDTRHRRHELVYAEATGYMLSLLALLARGGAREEALRAGRAAAEWLLAWTARRRGVVAMGIDGSQPVAEAYAFDNGVCCKGLLDFYELSGDRRYLECARGIAAWLVGEAMRDDGSVKPVFQFDAGRFLEEDPRVWYKASGAFHAKAAMGLLLLHRIEGAPEAREAARRLCAWAVRQQRRDGAFPANRHVQIINVHFHCYSVEAMLYAYAVEGSPEWLAAAERGVAWAHRRLRPDGSIPRWCGLGRSGGRGADVQAQATRIFALMHSLRPSQVAADCPRRAAQALLAMQKASSDVREDGGFAEGDISMYRWRPRWSTHMTSWSAMFALHALRLAASAGPEDAARACLALF